MGDPSLNDHNTVTDIKTDSNLIVNLFFEDQDEDSPSVAILSDTLNDKLEDATGLKTIIVSSPELSNLPDGEKNLKIDVSITKEGQVYTDTSQNSVTEDGIEDKDRILSEAVKIIEEEAISALGEGLDQPTTESILTNQDT